MPSILRTIDEQGVSTITLNKPKTHNAFDDGLLADLHAAVTETGRDESVRVLVVAAKGKSFSAGADLNWMKRMADYSKEENYRDSLAMAHFFRDLALTPKPTVAAVQGAALGGGMGLVACCDIAVASENALFGLTEVKLGLIPAVISPYVSRAIGCRSWQRYALTGERFQAAEALRLGLIHSITASEQLDSTVGSICTGLIKNSQAAMAAVKEKLMGYEKMNLQKLCEETAEAIADIRSSDDGREGIQAFLEKRKPAWRVD